MDVYEGSEDKEEVVALQMLLNGVFTTSLKVDGVVGKATADAIKAAQAAAALPEDGVAGPKTKAALLLARAALSAAPQADERYKEVVQRLLVAAKAQPVRWTLRRDDEPGEGLDEWMDAAQAELERAFGAWSKACRPSSSIDPGAGSSTDPLPAPAWSPSRPSPSSTPRRRPTRTSSSPSPSSPPPTRRATGREASSRRRRCARIARVHLR